jgi:hypothetical protein
LNSFRSSLHRGGHALPADPADDLAWISVAQMRELDRPAIEHRLTLARMMENAAAALAMVARALLGGSLCVRHMSRLATRSGPRLPSQGPRGLRSGHAPVSRGFHRQLASS